MCYHVKAMRELLDNHNIESLVWADNRDMLADGLTKGITIRSYLNDVLTSGTWFLSQKYEVWRPKQRRAIEERIEVNIASSSHHDEEFDDKGKIWGCIVATAFSACTILTCIASSACIVLLQNYVHQVTNAVIASHT